MTERSDRGTQEFHQGANAAAFVGLCVLAYNDVISSGMFVILMVALIGFYAYRHP